MNSSMVCCRAVTRFSQHGNLECTTPSRNCPYHTIWALTSARVAHLRILGVPLNGVLARRLRVEDSDSGKRLLKTLQSALANGQPQQCTRLEAAKARPVFTGFNAGSAVASAAPRYRESKYLMAISSNVFACSAYSDAPCYSAGHARCPSYTKC